MLTMIALASALSAPSISIAAFGALFGALIVTPCPMNASNLLRFTATEIGTATPAAPATPTAVEAEDAFVVPFIFT